MVEVCKNDAFFHGVIQNMGFFSGIMQNDAFYVKLRKILQRIIPWFQVRLPSGWYNVVIELF